MTPLAGTKSRGRPPIDRRKKAQDDRRRVLEKGLLACYEIIDRIRKEFAELEKKT